MIFTTKAEYGVRLLVELGRRRPKAAPSTRCRSRRSRRREDLPLAYLERIVALLRKAGLVESTRGAHGGYRLAREPESRSRWTRSIIALEGVVAPMECFVDDHVGDGRVLCSHGEDGGQGCATKLLWTRVQGGVIRRSPATTLAELVAFSAREPAPVATAASAQHR